MTTVVFNGVTLARPPGADLIVSYHAANWTSVGFCFIGMLLLFYPLNSFLIKFFVIIFSICLWAFILERRRRCWAPRTS